ncbi:hypothetical protein B586_18055 [Mycobacterium haemophilum DSM 44634]|nr:hypothetical protein B586_18055 [Mycobacterium haemophilum DSM 44634]
MVECDYEIEHIFDTLCGVGWSSGPSSWAEMERVLDGGMVRSSVAHSAYAELHAHSAYSFLDGASTPEELVEEAARLGLRALALTDHDGLYGAVRFAEAAAEFGVRTVFGAELSLGSGARTEAPDPPGPHLLVLARGPEGYRRLSRQLAAAHLAGGQKGKPRYAIDALTEAAGGHWHILTGCRKGQTEALATAGALGCFGMSRREALWAAGQASWRGGPRC